MRRLAGGIPRAFKNHQTPEGFAYARYVRALLARLGPLPESARPLLRECGRLVVDLERLRLEQDRALARRYLTVARRIDRRLVPLRTQLLTIEARLEELSRQHRHSHEDLVERLLLQVPALPPEGSPR